MPENRRIKRSPRRNRRGLSLVELAIVGPFFILLVIAGIDIVRMYLLRETAENAAYEAAKVALTPGATQEEVIAEARRELDLLKTEGTDVTVSPTELDLTVREVTVRIDVPVHENVWLLHLERTITAECTLQSRHSTGPPGESNSDASDDG